MVFSNQTSLTLVLLFVFAVIFGVAVSQPRAYNDELAGVVLIERIVAETTVAKPDDESIPLNAPVTIGTGFFIDNNLIVTNHHVAGPYPEPEDGRPALSNKLLIEGKESGKVYPGYTIASDSLSDIALVRIGDPNASPDKDKIDNAYWKDYVAKNGFYKFKFADSNKVNEGDSIHSIGHPSGMTWSVSEGIVSNPALRIEGLMGESVGPPFAIQVDSKIHPGNSGGPTIDSSGNVIGINTRMITVPGGSYGLAIPSNIVKRVTRDLLASGGKEEIQWAALQVGLSQQTKDNGREWPAIAGITEHGAAAKAKLMVDDQIMGIRVVPNRWTETKRIDDIMNYMALAKPKDRVALKILRKGKEQIVYMDLGSVPSTYYTQSNDTTSPGR